MDEPGREAAVRILLAEDHEIVREGLRALIERQRGMRVVAEAPDGLAAVEMAQRGDIDVAIVDIAMPELNGIEATRRITAAAPRVKVIALSVHAEKYYVAEMIKAGAAGYLLKSSAFKELTQALEAVAAGSTYLSPSVSGALVDYVVRGKGGAAGQQKQPGLSPRERQVLQLVAEGKSNKEIAAALRVSVRTVDTHRQHIMERLDLHSVAELTKFAVREGITSL